MIYQLDAIEYLYVSASPLCFCIQIRNNESLFRV